MSIDRLFGLPAHPLLVHLPVVLIPVLSLLAVILVTKPAWRRRWGGPLAAANVLMFLVVLLVTGSGEALQERLNAQELVARHRELGEELRLIWGVFTVLTVVLAIVDRWSRAGRQVPLAVGLSVLIVLGAVAATVWDVRTGHAGAQAVWGGVTTDAP